MKPRPGNRGNEERSSKGPGQARPRARARDRPERAHLPSILHKRTDSLHRSHLRTRRTRGQLGAVPCPRCCCQHRACRARRRDRARSGRRDRASARQVARGDAISLLSDGTGPNLSWRRATGLGGRSPHPANGSVPRASGFYAAQSWTLPTSFQSPLTKL